MIIRYTAEWDSFDAPPEFKTHVSGEGDYKQFAVQSPVFEFDSYARTLTVGNYKIRISDPNSFRKAVEAFCS